MRLLSLAHGADYVSDHVTRQTQTRALTVPWLRARYAFHYFTHALTCVH
jgi:hypothetical protein